MCIDAKIRYQSEAFSEAFSVGRRPPGGKVRKKLEESAKSAKRFLQPWISERNIKQQRLSMTSSRGIKCTLHHRGLITVNVSLFSQENVRKKMRKSQSAVKLSPTASLTTPFLIFFLIWIVMTPTVCVIWWSRRVIATERLFETRTLYPMIIPAS